MKEQWLVGYISAYTDLQTGIGSDQIIYFWKWGLRNFCIIDKDSPSSFEATKISLDLGLMNNMQLDEAKF
jgi:hypothetical protein